MDRDRDEWRGERDIRDDRWERERWGGQGRSTDWRDVRGREQGYSMSRGQGGQRDEGTQDWNRGDWNRGDWNRGDYRRGAGYGGYGAYGGYGGNAGYGGYGGGYREREYRRDFGGERGYRGDFGGERGYRGDFGGERGYRGDFGGRGAETESDFGPTMGWGEGEDRDRGWYARGFEGREHHERGVLARIGDAVRRLGKGPKGYTRSDDRIREDVCDRLYDHQWVDASDVEVKVEGGEVTLTGTVADRRHKRAIEDIAEDVRGVKEVHNQIRMARDTGTTTTQTATQPLATGAAQPTAQHRDTGKGNLRS
jgi:hypothetical protein